jgi:dihydropteroate synthase
MTHDLHPNEKLVFGSGAKRHEITGMILEQGSGALSPDEQARIVHLPHIALTEGIDAARAMLVRLDQERTNTAPAAADGAAKINTDALKRKRDEMLAAARTAYEAKVAAVIAESEEQ